MARVFISRDLPFPALDRLKEQHEVDVWEERTPPPPDAFLARARSADALLLTVTEKVDGDFLDQAPSVKAIANSPSARTTSTWTPPNSATSPSGTRPACSRTPPPTSRSRCCWRIARRISEGEREVREGRWAPWHPGHMLGGDLADQTLGIIGWGRIGQAMARRGEGFGMQIVHSSRSSGISLDELLETSDYVSLHTPLTPETKHLMGAAQFARMKPTAYFINTSRGGDRRPGRAARSARQRRRSRAPAWT